MLNNMIAIFHEKNYDHTHINNIHVEFHNYGVLRNTKVKIYLSKIKYIILS